MAESHPTLAQDMFVEMCKRFESLDSYGMGVKRET